MKRTLCLVSLVYAGLVRGADTEKRLQAQGLAPTFSIESFVIQAGPSFFDGAVKQVGQGIDSITAELQKRDSTRYASSK